MIALLLLMAAAPFWEARPPEQWSEMELQALLIDSPWAQLVGGPGSMGPVEVYLATAAPMEKAVEERARRAKLKSKPGPPPAEDPSEDEYRSWLMENRDKQIVVAVALGNPKAFSDEREVKRMEDGCVMHVGKKKYGLTGHFPPSSSDPVLRLVFPREVQPTDKTVSFDLYLPGVTGPARLVEFKVKDLIVAGRVEM